ncbi:MAG: hypothetical protein QOI52_1950 [Chloroflexota bacterium]|nr:hypothetical protein [Chloroflexota bacterium]
MILLRSAAAALAAASLAAAAAPAQPGAQDRLFNDSGPLFDAAVGSDGAMTFQFFDEQVRFRLPPLPGSREAELVAVLDKASAGHVAVHIVYDAAGARFDSDSGRLVLPVCRLEAGGARFDAGSGCGTGISAETGPSAALARAYGYRQKEDFPEAARILATVADRGDSGLHKFVLWLRASTEEGWELLAPLGSEESDTHRVAALRAYRELAGLEPGEIAHQFAIANLLTSLGAYGESEKIYGDMLREWPEESFRIRLGQSALARNQGHYSQSLEILDALGRNPISPQSMRYHYHRAWTLSLLRRYDEAIADLDAGLQIQADYPSAFTRRGCARAALGRLQEAIEDFDRSNALLAALPGGASSPAIRLDMDAVNSDRKQVADAIAARRRTGITGTCAGAYWRDWEQPRTRSRLLPAS